MNVLVAGDFIEDLYVTGTCSRICPEAPVPVLVPKEEPYSTAGGAGLVAEQLKAFLDGGQVKFISGSDSQKMRIFGNDHLLCRIDRDSVFIRKDFAERVCEELETMNPHDVLIVSDYGKGAFSDESAAEIMDAASDRTVDVFVDAKHHWGRYLPGAFALFPNQLELSPGEQEDWKLAQKECRFHVIQKLGARGCAVNGQMVPANSVPVRDTTGAGDVFLAAFVAEWVWRNGSQCGGDTYSRERLVQCAKFANEIAGESVKYLGTHVVTETENSIFKPKN